MLVEHLVRILKPQYFGSENGQENLSGAQRVHMPQVVGDYLHLLNGRTRRRGHLQMRAADPFIAPIALEDSVGRWMLRSGIQHENGGVARYFLSDVKRNKQSSTVITGYCAAGFMLLYERTADTRYLDAAVKAAYYLIDRTWDPQSCSMAFEAEEKGQKHGYFFDTGIAVRGLLAVWRKTEQKTCLAAAINCADFMAGHFFDGLDYRPIITLPDKKPVDYEYRRWSQSPGCYQLKASLAWLEISEITGEKRYVKLYRDFLQRCLETEASFLPGSDDDGWIMDRLHAYSFFLEGLLPKIDDSMCRHVFREGLERLNAYARKIPPKFVRSDVLAQLLRLHLFADHAGILPLNAAAIEADAVQIREFQSENNDSALNGGFWFGKKLGKMEPFMNPVSTILCYQALDTWERYQAGDRDLDWTNLI